MTIYHICTYHILLIYICTHKYIVVARAESNPEEIALDDPEEGAAANPEELEIDEVRDDGDDDPGDASMFAAVEIHNYSAAGLAADTEEAPLPQALAYVVACSQDLGAVSRAPRVSEEHQTEH